MKYAVFALLVLLCACATVRPTPLPDPVEPLREGELGPGDVVEIRVVREEELTGEYRIDADGMIGFPYLGAVPAEGRTARELAADLETRLAAAQVLVEPVVTLVLVEANSRVVYVLGQVKTPGSFTYQDGMGLVDAISAAGGVLETGLSNKTTVTRVVDGAELSQVVQVGKIVAGRAPDKPLRVGDIVYVPESPI